MNESEDRFLLKRVAAAVVLVVLFAIAAVSKGQDVPLEISGPGVRVVKVDRVIVVKEDRTVAKGEFMLKAPEGGALYSWDYPDGFKVQKRANVLKVLSAPNGSAMVSVEWVEIDFKAGKIHNRFGSASFDVGEPNDDPDPKPETALVKELRAALAKEPQDRSALSNLAKICLNAKATAKDGTVTDVQQIRDSFVAEVRSRVSPKLPYVRGVIVRRLDVTLPTTSMVLSGPLRDSIALEFDTIAAALERINQ